MEEILKALAKFAKNSDCDQPFRGEDECINTYNNGFDQGYREGIRETIKLVKDLVAKTPSDKKKIAT